MFCHQQTLPVSRIYCCDNKLIYYIKDLKSRLIEIESRELKSQSAKANK